MTVARPAAQPLAEPVPPGAIRITAIGGLGEVGLNCLLVDQRDERLVVDCGIRFGPSAHGIDHFEPPLGWADSPRLRIVGLVLTHGHEDHIGAAPALIARTGAPTWGPRHALELVRERLAEARDGQRLEDEPSLVPLAAGQTVEIGSFRVEAVGVAHSIAEAIALGIRTDAGRIVHTGDFTIHGSAGASSPTDLDRFVELGDEGVRLLLADSTNVEQASPGPDEARVKAALRAIVRGAGGRVVVGHFASNVHRMKILHELARDHDRQLCLLGRSMLRHADLARRLGHLPDADASLVIPPAWARERPRRRLLIAASGTQAEHRGAMRRLSMREHSELAIDPGDTVVLSSRTIPGNEQAVGQMLDGFWRQQAHVVTRSTHPDVHASGHASAGDLRTLIELVRPEVVLPVHGSRNQLERLGELARGCDVPQVVVRENGQPVLLRASGPVELGEPIDVRAVAISAGHPLGELPLGERRALGRGGLVVIGVDRAEDDAPRLDVHIHTRGIELAPEHRAALGRACARALAALGPAGGESARDEGRIGRAAERAAVSYLRAHHGQRPVVVAAVRSGRQGTGEET